MRWIAFFLLAACLVPPALAREPVSPPGLSAMQIVEKNVAARGGLDAWRKIQTMAWAGHIVRGNAADEALTFLLEMKRPNKTRFEIHAQNQKSVRLYDGTRGWKLRPARNGTQDLQPFSTAELDFARDGQGLDGPLMDYQAKGVTVTLEGTDEVEGSQAYRLNVTLPSGTSHHVWIDAKSFLDIKSDRVARNAFGMTGTVSVYYRDYRAVDGLQIPFMIETGADPIKTSDKMVIDRIVLNPPLEDWMFAKPRVPEAHHAIWTGAQQAAEQPAWPGTAMIPWHHGPAPASLPGAADAH